MDLTVGRPFARREIAMFIGWFNDLRFLPGAFLKKLTTPLRRISDVGFDIDLFPASAAQIAVRPRARFSVRVSDRGPYHS
jgi:hypothetical protein